MDDLKLRALNLILAGASLFCVLAGLGCAQETAPPPKADTTVMVPGAIGGSANVGKSEDTPRPKPLVPPK